MTPLELARSAAEHHGYDWHGVEVLQSTNALVARLEPISVVIKAGQWPDSAPGMLREHAICQELHALGEPVPEPLGTPWINEETQMVATLWRFVESLPLGDPAPAAFAQSLKRLHGTLRQTTTPLPEYGHWFDLFAKSLFDDAEMSHLDPQARKRLRGAYSGTRPHIDGHPYSPMRIHGEPHTGNFLRTEADLVILDLETVCTGPLEWDLASLDGAVADHYGGAIDAEFLSLLRRMNKIRTATWCFVNPTAAEHAMGRRMLEELDAP